MERAVLYARVSSKEQETEGYSIPAQLKFLHEYASKHTYSVVQEFVDVETAKKSGRPEFARMLAYVTDDPSVKHILVEKTDRLLRNFFDYHLIDQLISKKQNITIHLVKEGTILSADSRSSEKFVFGIKALMAKNFIDNLSEETKKGMLEKAEQGTYPSFAPYGYMNTMENGKRVLQHDPQTAPLIKKMFELYATGQYSLLSLKRKMLADGMVYRNGKNFYHSIVEKILKNEFYTGIFYWRGKKYENASHAPIITKELFREVQEQLARPAKQKSRKGLFAYTTLIKCGECGSSITAEIKKEKYIYYHCTGYEGACSRPYMREKIIDAAIETTLQELQITDEVQQMIMQELRDSLKEQLDLHATHVEQIEKEIRVLQNRIDQAYLDKLDRKIDETFWQEQNKKWLTEKELLAAKVQGYQRPNTAHLENAHFSIELAKRATGLFRSANVEQKRALVSLLVSNFFITAGNADLELKELYSLMRISSKTGNWRPQRESNPCFCRERATS